MRMLLQLMALTVGLSSYAQDRDSTAKDERNMMLNAESATVPREINIGLPESGNGAIVYVDGVQHANSPARCHFHWAGGNSYEPNGSISLMDAVISTGQIAVLIDSHTKFGKSTPERILSAGTSSNGRMLLDAWASGPLRKDSPWAYSVGAYLNYDPTSVNAPGRRFVESKQIFQGSLTRWGRNSQLSFLYRFSMCQDNVGGAYGVAPFVYNADGSTSVPEGFRLGRSCYFPSDDNISYMDVTDGSMRSGRLSEMDRVRMHDVSAIWKYRTDGGWKLTSILHAAFLEPSIYVKTNLAGIDRVGLSDGYTLADGTPFEGDLQVRMSQVNSVRTTDLEYRGVAEKQMRDHNILAGFSLVYSDQYEAGSSFNFAHTVTANPDRILRDGADTWAFNTNATYFDAKRLCPTLYAFDTWTPISALRVKLGLRLKYASQTIGSAARLDGQTKNKRVQGFNLADPQLCEINRLDLNGLDYAASLSASYKLGARFSAMAEGFYSMTNKVATYYKNASIPSTKPIGNALARAGLTYDSGPLSAAMLLSYITCWDCAAVMNVTRQTSSGSVTIPWTAQYGIGTPGLTLDLKYDGGPFKFHSVVTWQDPRYRNYGNEFDFGEGQTVSIDYSGNTTTGISKWLVELDPSYQWKRLKLWGSLRYYSRQYVSRTNLAYFNGHFETFGGADYKLTDRQSLSLSLVNILMQNGTKGSVDIADTITDPSELNGYLMAGTYIRPFTVDLTYTLRF